MPSLPESLAAGSFATASWCLPWAALFAWGWLGRRLLRGGRAPGTTGGGGDGCRGCTANCAPAAGESKPMTADRSSAEQR